MPKKKEYYNIREVSRLLQIPMSTLRYWDGEGLIRTERDLENNYRQFSLTAVMELSMVSFYRSLGIPLKELKQIMERDIDLQQAVLEEEEEKLETQIQKMYGQKKRIAKQKILLKEVERLRKQPFLKGRPAFCAMVEFEQDNRDHWEWTIQNPEEFILLADVEGKQPIQYGIGVKKGEAEQGKVIWREEEQGLYLECLFTASSLKDEENNLEECLEHIRKAGWRPQAAMAQFLTSGRQDRLLDYYKLWVQVEPQKCPSGTFQ